MAIRHLYFHIPFCTKRCPYCSFYVDTALGNKSPRFLEAILAEVDERSHEHAVLPQTIYFGGGTPSLLSRTELHSLFEGLRNRLDWTDVAECSFEANPESITPQKAELLHELGVNRISLGVQSWDDGLLTTLGRTHNAAQARDTFHTLRRAGFTNISIDLMFALPGQTRAQWQSSLEQSIALGPEHISCYCLTYEEDTAFFEQLQGGAFQQDSDWDADLFEMTMNRLTAAGYEQYEISNYARPGFASQHNSAYWAGAPYLGFGPSAFSTVGNQRWKNLAETSGYILGTLGGKTPVAFTETLTAEQQRSERLAFGLRTAWGVARSEAEPWAEAVEEFESLGLLETAGTQLRLTRRGRLLADRVAEAFV